MRRLLISSLFAAAAMAQSAATAPFPRWSVKAAGDWYAKQPWLVGSNYIPSYAINQLEMWQADTFDPVRIDMELGWAQELGMNTMRVFLHDLLWQQDAGGFKRRMDRFLRIADNHKMKIVFVLFDSCWDPFPATGKQRAPKPGVHNSGWVQGPGARALLEPAQTNRLLEYAKDVIADFANDKRILAWDLWNEPGNVNSGSYGSAEPANKPALVLALLQRVAEYARAGLPSQPLTVGLWSGDWSASEKLTPMERAQVEISDVLSFHNYEKPEEFEKRVRWLQPYNRPVLCTEYMARGNGSTFQGILPIARKYKVAAYNWGLVAGKTQTWLPWDSWQKPYTDREPAVWFHDVLTGNGRPYNQQEADFIREATKGKAAAAAR